MKVFHLRDRDLEHRINESCEPGSMNFTDMLNRLCRDLPILPKRLSIPVTYGDGYSRSCRIVIPVTDKQITWRYMAS